MESRGMTVLLLPLLQPLLLSPLLLPPPLLLLLPLYLPISSALPQPQLPPNSSFFPFTPLRRTWSLGRLAACCATPPPATRLRAAWRRSPTCRQAWGWLVGLAGWTCTNGH